MLPPSWGNAGGSDDRGVVYEFKAPEILLVHEELHDAWLSREDVRSTPIASIGRDCFRNSGSDRSSSNESEASWR